MKIYATYEHPVDGLRAFPRGFSVPALVFGPFWLAAKRLWVAAIVFSALFVLALWLEGMARSQSQIGTMLVAYWSALTVLLVAWLIPAFFGPIWVLEQLLEEGFELVDESGAESEEAAILRVQAKRAAELQSNSSATPDPELPALDDPSAD